MRAKTISELRGAEKMARLCGNNLALSFVPHAHEYISKMAVEYAKGNPEKMILAAEEAPSGGEANLIAFLDLKSLDSGRVAFHRPVK